MRDYLHRLSVIRQVNRQAREQARRGGYPSFEPAFRGYLTATWMHSPCNLLLGFVEPKWSVEIVRRCVTKSKDAEAEVLALLASKMYRPHLVGACAVWLGVKTPKTLLALWEAVDRETWVSPQLLVMASLCDPDFMRRARERLWSGVSVPKATASLKYLCRNEPWLPGVLELPHVQKALADDSWDHGDELAEWFLNAVQTAES